VKIIGNRLKFFFSRQIISIRSSVNNIKPNYSDFKLQRKHMSICLPIIIIVLLLILINFQYWKTFLMCTRYFHEVISLNYNTLYLDVYRRVHDVDRDFRRRALYSRDQVKLRTVWVRLASKQIIYIMKSWWLLYFVRRLRRFIETSLLRYGGFILRILCYPLSHLIDK